MCSRGIHDRGPCVAGGDMHGRGMCGGGRVAGGVHGAGGGVAEETATAAVRILLECILVTNDFAILVEFNILQICCHV